MTRVLWTREELILVLDLYLNNRKTAYKLSADTLAKYSSYLKKIHGKEVNESSNFRSPSSVAIRLRNYASIDPYWLKRGYKGLQNSQTADFRKIWTEFQEFPEDVREIANEIKRSLSDSSYISSHQKIVKNKSTVIEGKRQLRIHYSRERKSQRKLKLEAFKRTHGILFCEVCECYYKNYSDEVREKVFEVLHNVPLAIASSQVETKLDDLSVLYANCHRAIHGYKVVPTLDQMKTGLW